MPHTLAVFSDIHANLEALNAVLTDLKSQFPEVIEYYCPGDLVGYGPDPNEVINRILIEKRLTVVTKGNHDHLAGLGLDPVNLNKYITKFNKFAIEAMKWQLKTLNDEEKTFLYQLPSSRTCTHQTNNTRIAIIHGSPEYPLDEYIFPNSPQQKNLFPFMELVDLGILILGHTHIPFIDLARSEDLDKNLLMLNPGSVGQPRDRNPKASYAVIDVENLKAEIIRVDYDIEKVQEKIINLGLPEYLSERLQKGT